jgi:hypothetical protein
MSYADLAISELCYSTPHHPLYAGISQSIGKLDEEAGEGIAVRLSYTYTPSSLHIDRSQVLQFIIASAALLERS